jgi:hypothetical protein
MHPNPIHAFFAAMLSWFLVMRVRRTVGVLLIGATLFSVPAYAQIGLGAILAAAERVVDFIRNTLGPILDAIVGAASAISGLINAFRSLWEDVVYPSALINRARALASSLIATFRGIFNSLLRISVSSATLPNPVSLETILRNRSTGDFGALDAAYSRVYQALPPPTALNPMDRDLIDMDDAASKAMLKTLKASEAVVDRTVSAAEQIENEAQFQAPGSAAYISGGGITAAVRSQAMMMRMIAAEMRQEASAMAHENALRKRGATFTEEFRQTGSDVLRRR